MDCEFPIHLNWEKLARNLDISLDKRRALRKQVATTAMDYETVLEEASDMFVSNNSSPVTWEKFIFEVERVDRPTAAKMRKKLGFALTPGNIIIISSFMQFEKFFNMKSLLVIMILKLISVFPPK